MNSSTSEMNSSTSEMFDFHRQFQMYIYANIYFPEDIGKSMHNVFWKVYDASANLAFEAQCLTP